MMVLSVPSPQAALSSALWRWGRGFFTIRVKLDFEVKVGNGDRLKNTIQHGSPASIWHALDGAVGLAVIAILNDRKIVEYLTGAP